MSRKLVSLVYERKVGSVHRKAILAYFADRASDNGNGVWASKKTIADETECGRSTVIRIVSEFLEEGLISAVGTRSCRNGATIVYDLNVDAIKRLPAIEASNNADLEGSQSGTSQEQDQSQSGTPPVPERDPKGSHSGTQTVHEPSMNQSAKALFPDLRAPDPEKPPPKAQLPEGWVMPEHFTDYAREQGLTEREIEDEKFAFHTYFVDKRERRSERGWLASWQRWARKAAAERRRNPRQPAQGRENRPETAAEQITRLAGLSKAQGHGGV